MQYYGSEVYTFTLTQIHLPRNACRNAHEDQIHSVLSPAGEGPNDTESHQNKEKTLQKVEANEIHRIETAIQVLRYQATKNYRPSEVMRPSSSRRRNRFDPTLRWTSDSARVFSEILFKVCSQQAALLI